jgi:uncharacterized protein (TIGR03083 family)
VNASAASSGIGLVAPADAPALARAAGARAAEIVDRLRGLRPEQLGALSALPGWSRLTIACHLRYGAVASSRMTTEAQAGRTTAFYPGGRTEDRPATLQPQRGEAPADVVADLARASIGLADVWSGLSADAWGTPVREPAGAADLGPIDLATLAMLRLTEVDVHGSDLGLGLEAWSDPLLDLGLPFRVAWAARRARHGAPGAPARTGRWVLAATDGPTFRLSATEEGVTAEKTDRAEAGDAVVKGSRRDLLALLLGRPPVGRLAYAGQVERARRFRDAFPGP